MKIVLVMDQFEDASNGTTISARRFAGALAAHGNEVRVIACGEPGEGKYTVPRMHLLPLAEHLITGQGLGTARPDRRVFEAAAGWADVVHLLVPSPLCVCGLKVLEQAGTPRTAAFHCQPENITYSLHLGGSQAANDWIYNRFRDVFYNRFTHIHCPSAMIARQLALHGYTAQLHVISNGISPEFTRRTLPKTGPLRGKFCIVMVGRYSGEKRQDELIEACRLSRHARDIQLILAGRGLLEKRYRRLCRDLPSPVIMQFYPAEALRDLLAQCDLYVHTSDAEIEAMSCMEAFATGLVPVIADSPRSATPQFALDGRSLFPAGDSAALAERIDYWIEHPAQREEMGRRYAREAERYTLARSIEQMEEMFRQAIREAGRQE